MYRQSGVVIGNVLQGKRAQEAANERTKGLWLNMAQIWLDRAEDLKRIQQMVRSDNQAGGQQNLYGSA
jgi:hypothetical protein